MKLIAGLGNPGQKYNNTRHNLGFAVIELLKDSLEILKTDLKSNYILFKCSFKGDIVYLLKPLTYMNLSGNAVREVMSYYKIPLEDLLVIYDDMDLPFGRLRYRVKGSAGGHNGMKSIIENLKSQDFKRLRIGIGKNERNTISHVLGKFTKEEKQVLEVTLKTIEESLIYFLNNGIEKTMSKYNNPISIEDN